MRCVFMTALALLSVASTSAWSCSIVGPSLFKPTNTEWRKHAGPAQASAEAEGAYWEAIPAPLVKLSGVKRGTENPGVSCEDSGLIFLDISLPPESTYELDDFGIYFRVIEGVDALEIFADYPLALKSEAQSRELMLAWLDGHPANQLGVDLKVEAFLVSPALNIGASTIFQVKAAVGGQ